MTSVSVLGLLGNILALVFVFKYKIDNIRISKESNNLKKNNNNNKKVE